MDNRRAIMESALNLFYEKGYDAVGVQEIVDCAGVTKPTLYHYFGSKRGLLETLIQVHYEELEQNIRRAAECGENLPGKLYRVARVFFDNNSSNIRVYLLMLALFYSGRRNEGYQVVRPYVHRICRMFIHIFENAADELGNMHGRQRQFAISFIGVLDYHLMMLVNDAEDAERILVPDEQVRGVVQQFMYGIYS